MGVEASHTMAEADVDRMEKYKSMINRVGGKHGIALALIAAIISRESRAENMLDDGWGDYNPGRRAYNAWGLMQVDVNPDGGRHTPEGDWDSEEHLCQGTGILVDFIKRIRDKFPDWSREKQLKGGIAAYNMGDGNVHSYGKVDKKTTGEDYSNDVVARAQWYRSSEKSAANYEGNSLQCVLCQNLNKINTIQSKTTNNILVYCGQCELSL